MTKILMIFWSKSVDYCLLIVYQPMEVRKPGIRAFVSGRDAQIFSLKSYINHRIRGIGVIVKKMSLSLENLRAYFGLR